MRKRLSLKSYYDSLSIEEKEKLTEIKNLCLDMMRQYGVGHFKFRYGIYQYRLGWCSGDNTIGLEVRFVVTTDIQIIKKVILHEIAHAIVGIKEGHGQVWIDKARELGGYAEPKISRY